MSMTTEKIQRTKVTIEIAIRCLFYLVQLMYIKLMKIQAFQLYFFLCTLYLLMRKCIPHLLWEQVSWITATKRMLLCDTSQKNYTMINPFSCGFDQHTHFPIVEVPHLFRLWPLKTHFMRQKMPGLIGLRTVYSVLW